MEFIFALVGFLLGIIVTKTMKFKERIYGDIDVDEKTGLCRIRLGSNELSDPKIKHAVLVVHHGIDISRDEQTL